MRRTNTAQWMEKYNRWQIKVQKDGVRRTFYSSTPGRKGQREANAKADAWLDDGIQGGNLRVEAVYPQFVASILSANERERAKDMGRLYLLPAIGRKRVESLREDDFQTILDRAAACGVSGKPLSRKTLSNLASVMRGFVRFCRRDPGIPLHPQIRPQRGEADFTAQGSGPAVHLGHHPPAGETGPGQLHPRLPVPGAHRAAAWGADGIAAGGHPRQGDPSPAVGQ